MNEQIMKAAGFGEEVKLVKLGKCPSCYTDIDMDDFRDNLSRREYNISGLCQDCQDKIFG